MAVFAWFGHFLPAGVRFCAGCARALSQPALVALYRSLVWPRVRLLLPLDLEEHGQGESQLFTFKLI